MASYKHIKISCADSVYRLTLNRPEIKNAFNAELIFEITDAINSLSHETKLNFLVITAEGTMFCAGADFHWMGGLKTAGYEANVQDSLKLFDMFSALYDFPHPTIARVQGGAYGGGAGLIACCDFAIASQDAILSFSEVKIGLVPATISPFVVRKIGEGRTRDVFLTGRAVSADEALSIGLVNKIVETERLDAAVDDQVKLLLQAGCNAQMATKKLLRDISRMTIDQARQMTAEIISRQRISEEGQEGMSAFLEKRKPNWIGRTK